MAELAPDPHSAPSRGQRRQAAPVSTTQRRQRIRRTPLIIRSSNDATWSKNRAASGRIRAPPDAGRSGPCPNGSASCSSHRRRKWFVGEPISDLSGSTRAQRRPMLHELSRAIASGPAPGRRRCHAPTRSHRSRRNRGRSTAHRRRPPPGPPSRSPDRRPTGSERCPARSAATAEVPVRSVTPRILDHEVKQQPVEVTADHAQRSGQDRPRSPAHSG